MKIVYLDQNKWIELAQAAHGIAPSFEDVLTFVRRARDMKLACFPLSFTHYMETHKQHDPLRRSRLARIMMEVSGGFTVTPPMLILKHEILVALRRKFPHRVGADQVPSLNFLALGMAHATAREEMAFHFPEDLEALPLSIKSSIERWYELAMLSGVSPNGDTVPLADVSEQELGFKNYLDTMRARIEPLAPSDRDLFYYVSALTDIFEPLRDAMQLHGISLEEFGELELGGLRTFIDDMPTRRVEMHLYRQWAKNEDLKAKKNELYDWAQLASVVPYVDVLVAEKQFADLITRNQFKERAAVISDLRQLPKVLVTLDRN